MLRSIFLHLPVIKQIHDRSLDRRARNHIKTAMDEIIVGLPNVKDIGSIEELEQLIKVGLAERGIQSGPRIFKEVYRCPICNSTFDAIEGDDGVGKHLEVVHFVTLTKGGKK